MELGWVDFSKTERDKVVSILRLLETPTALDELGVGTVRDAFSEIFFPGISTLQTRAKYFVLVPYLFAMAERRTFHHRREVLAYIHDLESKLVETLVNKSDPAATGIIGSRNMKKGVKMKPSSIYWNGMRTTQIIRYSDLSLDEACEITLHNGQRRNSFTLKKETEDEAADDVDALSGKTVLFSPLVPDYDVLKEATIDLEDYEARYLYDRFLESPRTCNSLTAYMLREGTRFPSFDAIPYQQLPEQLRDTVRLGQEFADFMYGAHMLYNIIYADGCGVQDQSIADIRAEFENYRTHYQSMRLDDALALTRAPETTKQFLKGFDLAMQKQDISAAKELVIRRERFVKQNRAKLNNPKNYRYDRPIHNYKMDYRFYTAATIVDDILTGLGG